MKVEFKKGDNGDDAFLLLDNEKEIGRMDVKIRGSLLNSVHTEVLEAHQGKGYGIMLFDAMVEYARENNLMVRPICPFVQERLNVSPAEYADIYKPQ